MLNLIIKQRRAIQLCFILVFVLGFVSLSKLGTAELPEPPGSGIQVTAVLPGASPEEVDKKVARLLQNAIKDISGVKEVGSSSKDSFLSLYVKFNAGSDDHDALQREVSQVISQVPGLPPELEGPFISRSINRLFPVMTLLFEGGTDLQRHQAWFEVKQAIKHIGAVDMVDTLGDREQRIEIRLKTLKLQQLGLRIDRVSNIIGSAIADQAAGRQQSFLSLQRIRVKAEPKNLSELKALPINIKGAIFRLEQLAEVKETLAPKTVGVYHRGKSAWYVNIYRRPDSKVADISKALNGLVATYNQRFAEQKLGLKLSIVQDRNLIVNGTLDELRDSILLGMALVLAVLCLFFGFHNALYAAIGIPFAFFASFIAMDALGLTLNTLTLFGLVLVCGMIVDDAIVVLESVFKKLERGEETIAAIGQGIKEVLPAVLSSTGTTIAAFLPLLFISGDMGEFIGQIPKVAILALVASLFECLVILPIHIYHRQKGVQNHGRKMPAGKQGNPLLNDKMILLANRCAALAKRLIKHPIKSLLAFLVLFSISGLVSYQTMNFKMFNASEVRSLKFHLSFKQNTDLDLVSRLMKKQMPGLEQIDNVKDAILLTGFSDYNYARIEKPHLAMVELLLEPKGQKPQGASQVAERAKAMLSRLPGLEKLHFVMAENKPPEQAQVKIYLYGNEPDRLRQAAENVRFALGSIESIENISNPMEDGILEKVFNVNHEMASHYGISAKEIAKLMHIAVTGEKIAKMDRGNEVVDIYVMAKQSTASTAGLLNHLTLPNGKSIATDNLGTFSERIAPDTVRRYQGQRYIRITADINQSVLSTYKTHGEIDRLITPDLLPAGVSFEQLGEYTNTQESLASMIQSSLLALGLTYFILVLLFRSYSQPLIVMLTIPLAYVGVVWGFFLTGKPLSMTGLIGIIGLIGIVVNDSLVWIHCYNQQRQAGASCESAAITSVRLRFRPIMLTTITSILGLLPVSLADGAGIAGAMADTIVSGLLVASLLLMFFLPVALVMIERISDKLSGLSFSTMFKLKRAQQPSGIGAA